MDEDEMSPGSSYKKRKSKKKKLRVNPCLILLNVMFAIVGLGFIGVGVWLATNHGTSCVHFLQLFLIGSGLFMVALAATGLAGAAWGIVCLLYVNFTVMLLVLVIIVGTTVFVLVVTSHGITAAVNSDTGPSDPFSGWLRHQVNIRIKACTQNGQICEFVQYSYQNNYYSRPRLSALQAACCQAPVGCDQTNNLNPNATTLAIESDCEAWQQAGITTGFCSKCSLCRAAVAENIRHIWHSIAIFKIITLLVLIPMYFITCCYFKQDDDDNNKPFQECLNCCFNVI